ncbi:hypothetical protein WOLCODRAFT_102773 [Wolfiporia cocos MD-104 SS10]|uniref:Uncharacterized protein n=1 Tax=Wolfiporia cocos (strain MD-104) TaxID=742152 RepID=A0A2H3K3C5_WOLCO|nr:hypothetical protein WOLCODRAFT_102773 [Wolfiporia cocos MD-104 SS10]
MTEIAVQTLPTIAWSPSEVATTTPGSSAIDHHGADLMYNDESMRMSCYQRKIALNTRDSDSVGSFEDEDVALLGAQFWMLVVSFIAVLYRSIPQIVAVFCVRLIATMWSTYTVCRVTQYKPLFQTLYVGPRAPCQFDFFNSFFTIRMPLAITSLVLNTTALTFEGYMGRKLVKAFDVLIFQRVVPKASVLKIYRYFLAVFVLLQLDVVFMMSATGLWATWLVYAIGELTKNKSLYVALFVASMIALLPWLATGWFSVRREMKTLMIVFLLMGFADLVLWATMLRTDVFLWTFLQWPFFACLTCISFVLLFITGSFGIICRLNFGEGLAEYFHVEAVLAEANFAPGLFEEDTGSSDEKSMHKPTAVPAAEMYKNCELSEIGLCPVIVIGRV